jgi:ferric-dicitrate binding protein FerR (iron transport regulator)
MNASMIKLLLELYEEGKATEEQRQLVEAFLSFYQQQSPEMDWDPATMEASFRVIMEKIKLERGSAEGADRGLEAVVVEMGVGEPGVAAGGKRVRYAWMAAASVLLIAGVGLLWKYIHPRRQEEPAMVLHYRIAQAAPGKIVHLLLSDSSEVWLNAGSKLRYPEQFDGKMRELELLDGEAFFQVHPDPDRGFIVQTAHLKTQVLGTSFNIKAYARAQQVNVAVVTGKVAVIPEHAGATALFPDQQISYDVNTRQILSSHLASERMLNWRNGGFDFYEERFGDIAIELEHRFNIRIDFKYPGLKKYRISAGFPKTADVKDILATLCILNRNHLVTAGPNHYIIH